MEDLLLVYCMLCINSDVPRINSYVDSNYFPSILPSEGVQIIRRSQNIFNLNSLTGARLLQGDSASGNG